MLSATLCIGSPLTIEESTRYFSMSILCINKINTSSNLEDIQETYS